MSAKVHSAGAAATDAKDSAQAEAGAKLEEAKKASQGSRE